MLVKLQVGGIGWDVFVLMNYIILIYKEFNLIELFDLVLLFNYDLVSMEKCFVEVGMIDGKSYVVFKDWGIIGYVVNIKKISEKMIFWKDFWDFVMGKYSGCVMVYDYQFIIIGNVLKYYGYFFNLIVDKELVDVEKLLLVVKFYFFVINLDYQFLMCNGDVWFIVCWIGDVKQMYCDMFEIEYVIGKEGGEIWFDFYVVLKGVLYWVVGYVLINFLFDLVVNVKEVQVYGYFLVDVCIIKLLLKELFEDLIMYLVVELLVLFEFGVVVMLINLVCVEIMVCFKLV